MGDGALRERQRALQTAGAEPGKGEKELGPCPARTLVHDSDPHSEYCKCSLAAFVPEKYYAATSTKVIHNLGPRNSFSPLRKMQLPLRVMEIAHVHQDNLRPSRNCILPLHTHVIFINTN